MSETAEAGRPEVRFDYPEKFEALNKPGRYKVFYGGRNAAKSWTVARFLVLRALERKHLILCCREYQNSISDSVHRLISNQIEALGFLPWFEITQTTIRCKLTGSEFIFKGLRRSILEIKSTEGVTICWVEEATSVSEESWLVLDPTIRREGSEIWVTFNTDSIEDPTYKKFVANPPPNCLTVKVGWQDNKWFTPDQNKLRLQMQATDPDAYDWVWEGLPRRVSDAAIFHPNLYKIEGFETPYRVERFFFGADWGFANDPTVLIRAFIQDECLFIDHEAYAHSIEIDDIPALFAGGIAEKSGIPYPGIPGARDWPIKADSSRPETISYIARRGFSISAADKWPGSIEDGLAHLKGFKQIYIHERCRRLAQEFRLYSYKVDKNSKKKDILPIIEDKWNDGIDSCRYALDGYIQQRGGLAVWEKLGGSAATQMNLLGH